MLFSFKIYLVFTRMQNLKWLNIYYPHWVIYYFNNFYYENIEKSGKTHAHSLNNYKFNIHLTTTQVKKQNIVHTPETPLNT